MSNTKEIARDQAEQRGSADLRGQYRPIGIGAVAAALSATHLSGPQERTGSAHDAANGNERNIELESLAA